MIKPDDLKNHLHHPDISRKEQLILILATNPHGSHTSAGIKSIAKYAGIRGSSSWNISAVARDSKGLIIRSTDGWELTNSGREQTQQLLSRIGYQASSEAGSSPTKSRQTSSREASDVEVFISHAARDKELASRLVMLLTAAFSVRKDQIRCTSVPGCKLPSGADSSSKLSQEIALVPVFIGLLTPNSLKSTYVLFELGARWATGGKSIPLLGLSADYDIIPAPIRGQHALKIETRTDLQQMLSELSSILNRKLPGAESYEDELVALMKTSMT